jgi:hypothetical protein
MPDVVSSAAFVTALIKHGVARIASAFLCVLGGISIGHDANTRPEPNKFILQWVSTILETFGAGALMRLIALSQVALYVVCGPD